MKIPCNDSKITSAVWGPLGECIIAGHESGELNQYSAKVRGRVAQPPRTPPHLCQPQNSGYSSVNLSF